jgi:hypothetical protein
MKNPKMTKTLEKLYLAGAGLWDSGELGRDDAYVKVADSEHLAEVNEALGLKIFRLIYQKHYTAN